MKKSRKYKLKDPKFERNYRYIKSNRIYFENYQVPTGISVLDMVREYPNEWVDVTFKYGK